MSRVLVIGAGGFIGRALCPCLAAHGHSVIAGVRAAGAAVAGAESRVLGELAPGRGWAADLHDIDVVIHLAQRAHRHARRSAFAGEPEAAAALARGAAEGGVRRLVYMSSIKAMGEASPPGRPFRAGDVPRPREPYGEAKLATERALARVAAETGLELVVLRPPLVYGPGVGGNFRALLRLAGCGLPLPFAAVDNRRSLIAIDNLVDLVATTAVHPAAAGNILLAADASALSTPALIAILAQGQGRPARLFALPGPLFAMLRGLPGLGPAVSRLTLSLEIDDGATRAALGWTPPVATEPALIATARAFGQTRGDD